MLGWQNQLILLCFVRCVQLQSFGPLVQNLFLCENSMILPVCLHRHNLCLKYLPVYLCSSSPDSEPGFQHIWNKVFALVRFASAKAATALKASAGSCPLLLCCETAASAKTWLFRCRIMSVWYVGVVEDFGISYTDS